MLHPIDGHVRLVGVTSTTNDILHGWLKRELTAILADLPGRREAESEDPATDQGKLREYWERWQQGLTLKPTLLEELPPLRMLLILDNLAGHKNADFVCWLFSQGVMPLYTPLGGSWLNMAESIQRILKRRALNGQHPSNPEQIMAWFVAVAEHWNRAPTPFKWAGKRKQRRERQRERRHRIGGSAAYTTKPIRC